jgi:hypothetical protein
MGVRVSADLTVRGHGQPAEQDLTLAKLCVPSTAFGLCEVREFWMRQELARSAYFLVDEGRKARTP